MRSIRSKVLLITISIMLITAFSITIIFYQLSCDMIEKNYSENLYARIRQMGDSLDESLEEIYNLTTRASCDEKLADTIKAYQSTSDKEELEELSAILKDYSLRDNDIGSIYLLMPKERVMVTSQEYPTYKLDISSKDTKNISDLSKVSMIPKAIPDPLEASSYLLSFVSKVTDKEGNVVAYLMNNVDERVLYYKYLDSLNDGKSLSAVILDNENRIVSNEEQNMIGHIYENATYKNWKSDGVQDDKNSNRLGVTYQTNFTGFRFFLEVDKNYIVKDLEQIKFILSLILFICCTIAAVLAYFITGAVYRPLKELTRIMGLVSSGELSQRVEVTSQDEIGTLSKEFNSMLQHIEELIGQLVKEELLKKDAELEALQYQITPHFMYNTLNSIKFAALLKGEKEIGSLLEDFIELLQASVNKKGVFVTIADEVHFLQNYVNLQRIRHEGRFMVEYEVEVGARDCYVPRLILQPIVENALLHGMDMKYEGNRIVIKAWIEGQMLHLTVKDNGKGMTKSQINQLLNQNEEKTSGLSGIGVVNVKERLYLYYGSKGTIYYRSNHKGTEAHIRLPVSKEQEEYKLKMGRGLCTEQ